MTDAGSPKNLSTFSIAGATRLRAVDFPVDGAATVAVKRTKLWTRV